MEEEILEYREGRNKEQQKEKVKLQEKIRNKMIDYSTKSLIMIETNGVNHVSVPSESFKL